MQLAKFTLARIPAFDLERLQVLSCLSNFREVNHERASISKYRICPLTRKFTQTGSLTAKWPYIRMHIVAVYDFDLKQAS